MTRSYTVWCLSCQSLRSPPVERSTTLHVFFVYAGTYMHGSIMLPGTWAGRHKRDGQAGRQAGRHARTLHRWSQHPNVPRLILNNIKSLPLQWARPVTLNIIIIRVESQRPSSFLSVINSSNGGYQSDGIIHVYRYMDRGANGSQPPFTGLLKLSSKVKCRLK